MRNVTGDLLWAAGRWGARTVLKIALAALAPFVPWLLVFAFLAALVGAVYVAMPVQSDLDGDGRRTEADERLKQRYEELAAEYTVKETWLSTGEGKRRLGYLADSEGKDRQYALKWGLIHAAALYKAFAEKGEISDALRERVAQGLRPFFYYKESKVVVCGKDGCESYTVYLLTEADTVLGHYRYYYRRVTKSTGGGSVSYEELDRTETVSLWDRLDGWIREFYGVDRGVEETRAAILQGGEGFFQRRSMLDWLLHGSGGMIFGFGGAVPAEVRRACEAAEARFGIPWNVLAAICFVESSYGTNNGPSSVGALGPMQFLPSTWATYGIDGDGDGRADIMNLWDSIFSAANYLRQLGWGPGSEARVLAHYGGDRTGAAGYAAKVLAVAQRILETRDARYVWPVPGTGPRNITTFFGVRDALHPDGHRGIDIAAPEGAPAVAAVAGRVTRCFWDAKGGGNTLFLLGEDGYLHEYLHLSGFAVSEGTMVAAGGVVGYVGSTGRSTGPHLHYAVKRYPFGQDDFVDPLRLFLG